MDSHLIGGLPPFTTIACNLKQTAIFLRLAWQRASFWILRREVTADHK